LRKCWSSFGSRATSFAEETRPTHMAELLSTLLDVGTPRPAARWLLVAKQGSQAVPLLEGKPVPLGPSGWVELPADLSLLTEHTVTRSNSGARK
jgi:hypothetical protein